jgi:HEAT repeat protein
MIRTITGAEPDLTTIQQQIDALAASDVIVRDRGRHALVRIGQPAVRPLLEALASTHENVRLEAAQALGEIADPAAATGLIETLDDERFAVRWVAAEALVALGQAGVVALLNALLAASWDNVWLREGAHHVLRAQLGASFGHHLAPVIAALEGVEPSVTVPTAAYHAIEAVCRDGD